MCPKGTAAAETERRGPRTGGSPPGAVLAHSTGRTVSDRAGRCGGAPPEENEHPRMTIADAERTRPLRAEVLGPEGLERLAAELAAEHRPPPRSRGAQL